MCSVSSLYGDQVITGLLKSCKGWGKVLLEIQFEFKIQIDMDHSNNFKLFSKFELSLESKRTFWVLMNSCSLFILKYLCLIGHQRFVCLVLYCDFNIYLFSIY